MGYLGELMMAGEIEVARRLVMEGLARDGEFLGIKMGYRFGEESWLKWRVRGRISAEYLKSRNPALGEEFGKLIGERKLTTHLHELLMLGEILPEGKAYTALTEEFGSVEKEKLKGLVNILLEAGIVERA